MEVVPPRDVYNTRHNTIQCVAVVVDQILAVAATHNTTQKIKETNAVARLYMCAAPAAAREKKMEKPRRNKCLCDSTTCTMHRHRHTQIHRLTSDQATHTHVQRAHIYRGTVDSYL